MKLGVANRTEIQHLAAYAGTEVTDMVKMSKETGEALFGLHVDAFLAGVSELVPEPAEFGLSDDEAAAVRDEIVRDHVAA